MKSEILMDCIGQIDDDIIIEADVKSAEVKSVRYPWTRWIPVAAIAACFIVAMLFLPNQIQPTNPADFSNLPKLTVNTELGSYGFEGYLAYDVNELRNGNPWTENNDLKTMPVFANPGKFNSAGVPVNGLSSKEMLAEAEKIADLFGLEITSLYTEPTQEQIDQIVHKMEAAGASEEEIRQNTSIYRATAECRSARIEVQNDGHIVLVLTPETAHLAKEIGKLSSCESFTISFKYGYETIDGTMYSIGLPLPEGYSFTYNTTYEQAVKITQYLFSEFGSFLGTTEPGYDLSADYTYSGVLMRPSTFVFDNSGSLADRILNYNFRRLYFTGTNLGELGAIKYYNADLSQKIGDYPIITAREARKLLLENHYITTVPEEFPGEKYIAHVELIYRTSGLNAVFMPYYKFLVEMPTMELENGLKTFGAFYVPAVKGEFLENMPLWDGNFN